MLYLKEADFDDIDREYEAITNIPEDENGFTNPAHGCSREEFEKKVLPEYLKQAQGIDLPEGRVPQTMFFLYDEGKIVGLFKIRHNLNESLRKGSGHIGYCIIKEYRKKGYATKGLKLASEKARTIISENEIYLSVNKDNPASLKVQLKNGAYIHHEDEDKFYTRIKL